MDIVKLSDEELALLVQQNNYEACEEILNRYKQHVVSWVRAYFLTCGDSEDLVQEGMVAVFAAISSFNGKTKFKTYAKTCVKNRIFSVIRTSKRLKNQPLDNYISLSGWADNDSDKTEIIIDTAFGPEEEFIHNETEKELVSVIRRALSDYEYRILFLYLNGYSYTEIEEKLGKSRKSVDNALQRIRKKILTAIDEMKKSH